VSPPKILFFVIKRYGFDYKTNLPYKKLDPFSFEKEIYIDRFLKDNIKSIDNLAKIKILEEEI